MTMHRTAQEDVKGNEAYLFPSEFPTLPPPRVCAGSVLAGDTSPLPQSWAIAGSVRAGQ